MQSRVSPKLMLIVRITVFVLSAYLLSYFDLISEYWYVGPAFGAVVLLWSANSAADLARPRSWAFLAASTLIYALVALIIMDLDESVPKYDDLFDAGFLGVMIGTVLLPIAQRALLGGSWTRLKFAIPGIYLIWHPLVLAIDRNGISDSDLLNAMSIWQGLYLVWMFGPASKFLNRQA